MSRKLYACQRGPPPGGLPGRLGAGKMRPLMVPEALQAGGQPRTGIGVEGTVHGASLPDSRSATGEAQPGGSRGRDRATRAPVAAMSAAEVSRGYGDPAGLGQGGEREATDDLAGGFGARGCLVG
jgi:hypothetical protein